MTDKEFIRKVISYYHKARKPGSPHNRIYRGESHSISSKTEDLFAKYLIEKLPNDTEIFINQTITTGTGENRIRVKPDLVIVRQNTIRAILDLKMDLGYKRDSFPNFWDERDQLMLKMRGKTFSLYKKKGKHRTHLTFVFANTARLFLVVISDRNIKKDKLDRVTSKKGNKQYSETYFLTHHLHPNAYDLSVNQVMEKIEIDFREFAVLRNELENIV